MGAFSAITRFIRRSAIVITMLLLSAACGTAASTTIAPASAPAGNAFRSKPLPAHIAVIVMEDEEYGDVIGSKSAPYINRLANTYGLATRMYGIRHPSLPNYLALTGGSTFGITDDCTDCTVNATSIVDQLESAGLSWKAYIENYPGQCFTGSPYGPYAKRHNPFVYYTRVFENPARCANIVPLNYLYADESRHTLPRFIWITPNLCHDMHDCSVATGDRFLSRLVPNLLKNLGPNGLLILTHDAGNSNAGCCSLAAGGHMPTVVAGPGARRRARLNRPVDTYSTLQLIEDTLHLPRLRNAGCRCTPSLKSLLR